MHEKEVSCGVSNVLIILLSKKDTVSKLLRFLSTKITYPSIAAYMPKPHIESEARKYNTCHTFCATCTGPPLKNP